MNHQPVIPNHNFPAHPVPLVGREREIREISALLADPNHRLVTLYGFGGCGKTRLALETGRMAENQFSDGVWFVALAPLHSTEQILAATASAIGFSFGSSVDHKVQLFNFLHTKKMLLILDNLEHLLPDAKLLIEDLLQNVQQVRLLVTSRQPVNTPWEWAYSLSGLEYSENSSGAAEQASTAVELFLQQLRREGQPARDGESRCAEQICRLVNGLPLALILAASWGRVLGCDEIAQEIKNGVGILRSRKQSFPDKHSSMQAVFEYSWQLLSEVEKGCLRKLSVFRGGFTRAAIIALSGVDLDIIASLVDYSLVERIANDRYQIHELFRGFLRDRMAEAGDSDATRDGHLNYYLRLAEQGEMKLIGRDQVAWIERLNLEIDNFSAALEWCLEKPERVRVNIGLHILSSTGRFWILPMFTKTGAAYLAQLLDLIPENTFEHGYARALNLAGRLSLLLEELAASRAYTQQALMIGLHIGDSRLIADSLTNQTSEAFYRKDYQLARTYAQQALNSYQENDYAPGILQALENLGRCEIYCGDFEPAQPHLAAGLELAKKMGDAHLQCSILRGLGEILFLGPNIQLPQARAFLEEGLEVARQFKDQYYIAHTLNSLGEIARMEEQYEDAIGYYQKAISIEKELGRLDEVILDEGNLGFVYLRLGRVGDSKAIFLNNLDLALKSDHLATEIAFSELGLAGVAIREGEAQLAAYLLGAIDSVKETFLFFHNDRREYEQTKAAGTAQLGDQEFAKYFQEGQAADLTKAAHIVLKQEPHKRPIPTGRINGLTIREIEVLRLVTYGLSDLEVAERLVISPRTVNAHLTTIYRKLDVVSRAAAARIAREKGLIG